MQNSTFHYKKIEKTKGASSDVRLLYVYKAEWRVHVSARNPVKSSFR